MNGRREFDLDRLRAEVKEHIEEVRARGPVKLSPARDDDEVFQWFALYDPEVTTIGLPEHYPDIDHLICGSNSAEIGGKLLPVPQNSKCGGQILEIEERFAIPTMSDAYVDAVPKPTEVENDEATPSSMSRLDSAEAQREFYWTPTNVVPGAVFRTAEAKGLKILDQWFGIGREGGSPFERRLVRLKTPCMYAWVWCKARGKPH